MQSDEDIRQIIFSLRDSDNPQYDEAIISIRASSDIRFLNIAMEILLDGIEEDYEPAYLTIQNLAELDSSLILKQVLPLMEHPVHCEWAIRRAAGLDINTVYALPRFTNHPDDNVRYTALWAIDGLGHPDRLEIALYMLNDKNAEIRAKACRVLSVQGFSVAVESLIARLNDNEAGIAEAPVSAEAAAALGKIGDESAIPSLQEVVKFRGEYLACAALRALGLIDVQASEAFFLEQIHHPFESVRRELVQYIGSLGASHVDVLISITKNDSSYYVQKEAANRLSLLGTTKAKDAAAYWYEHYHRVEDEFN